MLNLKIIYFYVVLLISLTCCEMDKNEIEVEQRQFYKLGEFNDRCRSTRDCRQFGYVCRDNRTCQCDFMYIPDSKRRTCIGGVNQRCIYDEHCIEGAFCMNQAVCKCKDSSPIELDEGLVCSGGIQLESLYLGSMFSTLTIILSQVP